ncbi:PIN domain-containing protein [Micromonospora chersina]|uniref:PIN domain-containing protein n=1 Tax=Micromonospora chersina TaxID=47854 RepID=UPI0037B8B98E
MLDTTAITSDPFCSSTAWRVLAHASGRWGVKLATTMVVIAEAVANYGRETTHSVESLEKWIEKFGRLGLRDVGASAVSQVADIAASYEDDLGEILQALNVEVLEPQQISHVEVVRRAADRKKPCDSHGNGYRDTLNWLMVLELAESRADEEIIWVTANSNDFADEKKKLLHPDLLSELEEKNLSGRVTWQPTLKALVLDIARQRSQVGDDDLRPFYEKLRNDTLVDFLTSEVLPAVEGTEVDPMKCGLYIGTFAGQIAALGQPQDLIVEVRSSISPGEAVAEFSFTADTTLTLAIHRTDGLEDDELSVLSGDDPPWILTVTKPLVFRGILSLGPYEKPTGGEIVEILAPDGDPGLAKWRQWRAQSSQLARHARNRRLRQAAMRSEVIHRLEEVTKPALTPDVMRRVRQAREQLERAHISPEMMRQIAQVQKVLQDLNFPDQSAWSDPHDENSEEQDNLKEHGDGSPDPD